MQSGTNFDTFHPASGSSATNVSSSPSFSRHLARERLSGTIDNFIRTGTGMTIHVTFAPAFEIEREVRKALFNRGKYA